MLMPEVYLPLANALFPISHLRTQISVVYLLGMLWSQIRTGRTQYLWKFEMGTTEKNAVLCVYAVGA